VKVAVVTFPGSNCDRDTMKALARVPVEVVPVWHRDQDLKGATAAILPGGFSYGDYLRAGALAAHSPIMGAVKRLLERGGQVLGICNGFQVLTESGLLPGALTMNISRRFQCEWVTVRVETALPGLGLEPGDTFRLPIANGEGRYLPDPDHPLGKDARAFLTYVGPDGERLSPNGSWGGVAGVASLDGRVVGLMPHPERASAAWLGGEDGLRFLQAWVRRAEVAV
jgi:phosphoribosylformylglycinamidine synthase I